MSKLLAKLVVLLNLRLIEENIFSQEAVLLASVCQEGFIRQIKTQ